MSITARHEGLFEGTENYTFHILGCGAIGSSAALQLARMGAAYFHLYDRDKVEDVNIGVSQYGERDIGREKVDALKGHLLSISRELIVYKDTEMALYEESFHYGGY